MTHQDSWCADLNQENAKFVARERQQTQQRGVSFASALETKLNSRRAELKAGAPNSSGRPTSIQSTAGTNEQERARVQAMQNMLFFNNTLRDDRHWSAAETAAAAESGMSGRCRDGQHSYLLNFIVHDAVRTCEKSLPADQADEPKNVLHRLQLFIGADAGAPLCIHQPPPQAPVHCRL